MGVVGKKCANMGKSEGTVQVFRSAGADQAAVGRLMLRVGGVAALARAKQRREAAVAAQTERMTAEKAAIAKAHKGAKEHGVVEKTAGESGAAGKLRNKWVKWLRSDSEHPR
jgi:hypothetical protein